MRLRKTFPSCLIGGAVFAGLLTMAACDDYGTGQDPEPPGPLRVERLTLTDFHQFIDTSAPLDCEDPALKNTTDCVNSPFRDNFSIKKNPPTPDHASKLRVVFNKLPLKVNGQDVETSPADGLPTNISQLVLRDPGIVKLECDGCTGIPASYNSLQVTGSSLSPDPTVFDYGPALQMEVLPQLPDFLMIAPDPVRALEPNTTYRVVLNPGLSGRNAADKVLLDDRAKSLLTFTTQPFAFTSAQKVDVVTTDSQGADSDVGLANDGALVIGTNAGVDYTRFRAATVMAAEITVDGGAAMSVPVVVTTKAFNGASKACEHGNQRRIMVVPTSGSWLNPLPDAASVKLRVVLRGADIRDVSQDANHTPGMGRSTLAEDVEVKDITIVAKPVDMATGSMPHRTATAVMSSDVLACIT